MDNQQLLELYDQEERIRAEFPAQRREETPWGVRHVPIDSAAGMRDGFVSYSRLSEQNADQIIDEQVAYCARMGITFEWKAYSHDTPPDLRDRLAARGFDIEDAEAIMVLDLQEAPALLLAPVTHDVRRIVDPDEIGAVVAVQGAVWQEDKSGLAEYLSHTMRDYPEVLTVYAAYADGQIISSAWLTYRPPSPFAGMWGGSTLAAYRKQGFYTALVAVRVQEALRRGARFLTIDASPMSRSIVERFGFRHITTAYACNWRHDGSAEHPA